MNRSRIQFVSTTLFALVCLDASAADGVRLQCPVDYQVFQRHSPGGQQDRRSDDDGILVKGDWPGGGEKLFGHLVVLGEQTQWEIADVDPKTRHFQFVMPVHAGGWYRLELHSGSEFGPLVAWVEHVGVGEIFIVAGQSNSTNYGAEKLKPETGLVSAFDGSTWRLADDPQPGTQDRSKGGSFLPAFGDAMAARYQVPIGVASTGAGATSVRQWLMKGEKIDVLPTLTSHVKTIAPGQWEASGDLFDGLMKRIDALGPQGFRAVLWHQGESDAGQARAGYPADRQITGRQYRQTLEKIILATRQRAGWQIPWFVAQATYHSPTDAADAEFRAAQKSLWDDGVALAGPDTDALTAEYRNGVQFNGKGQRAHGKAWAEKVSTYLDKVLPAELGK